MVISSRFRAKFRGLEYLGLACNHTMERITFCTQKCNLVMLFDHVFSKIFG